MTFDPRGRLMDRSSRSAALALILLLVFSYGVFGFYKLGAVGLGQDEARYGTSGLNILADYHQLARVGESPLGPAATKPFVYPAALAASIKILGKSAIALRTVNVLGLAIAGLLLFGVIDTFIGDRILAFLTLALFILNPGTLTYARVVMAEPFVVMWGCVALFSAARFYRKRGWKSAALCGVALGLGFLSKLWLIYPLAFACALLFLVSIWRERSREAFRQAGLALILFALVSSAHLLLVAMWTPADLGHWFGIYFGFSFATRFAGHAYDPALWFRPWWFYFAAFFRASSFALPLVFLGVAALVRRRSALTGAFIAILVSPVFLFSILRVKEAAYIFPAFPGLALLLAIGLVYFVQGASRDELIVATGLSIVVAWLFYKPWGLGASELGALELLYVILMLAGLTRSYRLLSFKSLAIAGVAVAMLLADLLVVRRALQAPPSHLREIAEYFRPMLAPSKPGKVVFTSPLFEVIGFYTFRTGVYWRTYYFHTPRPEFVQGLEQGDQDFYVVDPSEKLYGSVLPQGELNALHRYAVNVTPQIEHALERQVPLEVYVPLKRLREFETAENTRDRQTPIRVVQ